MALFYDNILSSTDDDEMFYPVQRRPRVFRERVNYFETMDELDFLTRLARARASHANPQASLPFKT